MILFLYFSVMKGESNKKSNVFCLNKISFILEGKRVSLSTYLFYDAAVAKSTIM
jgi:hypothetical protein